MKLNKKNVLFICRKYFEYELYILDNLKDNGYNVTYWQDVPYNNLLFKILNRFNFLFIKIINKIYYNNLIASDNNKYDYIFVIIGESLDKSIVENLRRKHANAKLIYYIWDSIKNRRSNCLKIIYKFDVSYSYSRLDSEKYGLKYLPLFALDIFKESYVLDKKKYNLGFVGTAHSDRARIISKILDLNPLLKFKYHLYVYNKYILLFYRIFNPNYWGIKNISFSYKKFNKDELTKYYSDCDAVLDIEHFDQNGLTIRTFEVLSTGIKLVTTNAEISHLKSLDQNQYLIINRLHPVIPSSFYKNSRVNDNKEFIENYSLDNWLKIIFS